MTILVSGGAGFVGSHVVKGLLERGERVVIYDQSPRGNAFDLVLDGRDRSGVELAQGLVTDGWTLLRLCEREAVESIVHLASPLTQDVAENPETGIRDICLGTSTVLEVARALRLRRVVWASSVAVFGERKLYGDDPIANDAPHQPESLYGSCKSLCERLALHFRERYDVDSIGLRLTVVYGPGRLRGYMSFPSDLIRRAALGQPIVIPIADQKINWQYVGEVSAMVIHALHAARPSQHVFNTYGDVRSFRDAAEVLSRLAPNVEIDISEEATDAGQRMLRQAPFTYDDTALRREICYEPRFPLEVGIEESYRAFRRLADQSARAS